MIWIKRLPHLLLSLMFLAFAFVQINDPDPLLWILIYLAMAILCALAAYNKYYQKVMFALVAGYLVYMFILFPGALEWYQSSDRSLLFDDIAKMQYYYIEESREFLGLLICEIVLGVYIFIQKK
ncbi:MAG TPA: transmembrane 220 family protein [Cyclobacteriaceae bacterium]